MIRRLMTEEERKKKSQRNRTIMSIILAIIMLFSTAGYFVMDFSSEKTSKVMHNSIEFKQNEYGSWDFSTGGKSFQTLYNPEQTANISANIASTIYTYSGQPLYFSGIPVEDIPAYAMQEIAGNIGSLTARVNYACLDDNCSRDYAVKNCSNDNVIVFKESEINMTKVTQSEKCVQIEYASGEAERASDAFLFRILGA